MLRARIKTFCRKSGVKYLELVPKLKYNRSGIDKQNSFIVLDLMMDLGAQISLGEYRQWSQELKNLMMQGYELHP